MQVPLILEALEEIILKRKRTRIETGIDIEIR